MILMGILRAWNFSDNCEFFLIYCCSSALTLMLEVYQSKIEFLQGADLFF